MSEQHDLIGPYRVLQRVGGGGQGSVYLGQDLRLQRRVAIKVHRLPPGARARRDALREARNLARMRDARVIQIYDVVESADYVALVMEYLPGCDLETVLGSRRLSLASSLLVARDVAAAIAAARRHRIVHGDIKAANVLIGRDGRARLTDFGIARRSASTAGAGSLSVAAPEQLAGGQVDVRTDLFALGRLLYRMLGGSQSGDGGQSKVQLPDADDLPPDLAELVGDLLQVEPAHRPRNTQPVRNRLRRIVAQLPLSPHNPLLPEVQDCFRPEPEGELPPRLPSQLSRRGRSRNHLLARRRQWRALLGSRRLHAAMVALAVATASLLAWVQTRPPYGIHVNQPVLAVEPGALLDERFTSQDLAVLVGDGLRARLGPVQLTGAVPLRTLRVGGEEEPVGVDPSEWLDVSLRCSDRFCILALLRRHGGGERIQRDLLFADASPEQWQQDVGQAVATLYRDWQP